VILLEDKTKNNYMSILFRKIQKAQNGMMLPVEGQLSPSGKAKYVNGQWVGVPITDIGKITDVNGVATQNPGIGYKNFDVNLGKGEMQNMSINAGLNTSLIGAFRPDKESSIQAGDTTYAAKNLPTNTHYEIPYQSNTNKPFDITLKGKGNILGSVHTMNESAKKAYRLQNTPKQ
jgi:hypothetical protein